MKIDLHCHSKHSKRPSLWLMQKIGCPESFTEPEALYCLAKAQGMTAVTITDHNVIDGCLEIAHHPDTFISEEVTTYFPQDGCKLHVLVHRITEAQHQAIQSLRENVYEMVDYLEQQGIHHAVAHPLFAVNDRLTAEHLEELVLLFKNVELNGDQCAEVNAVTRAIFDGITPEDVERFAHRHGRYPRFAEPWRKTFVGGSDDHSSLHLACTYTEVKGAATIDQYFRGIERGRGEVVYAAPTPQTFAHSVYGIAYQYYKNRLGLGRHVHRDIFLRFLDQSLQGTPSPRPDGLVKRFHLYMVQCRGRWVGEPGTGSVLDLVRSTAQGCILEDEALMDVVRRGSAERSGADAQWFRFVNEVSNRVLVHFGRHALDRVLGASFFDIFHTLGSAGALYTVLAPYFVSYAFHTKVRRFSREMARHFDVRIQSADEARIGHFTDTFHEVNGVARTLRQQVDTARRLGKVYEVLACDELGGSEERLVRNFTPVGSHTLPEYPEQKLHFPPFLDMLSYCYDREFTHIHSATPGPAGLAALAVARILKLPISGTYHTAFPQYALTFTEDCSVEDMMWRYMLWYYDQMDTVYAPSESTAKELTDRGLHPSKVRVYPRGIDTEAFHPKKRSRILGERYGVGGERKLLYVGRISREKNLHLLATAYRRLAASTRDVHLVIVGDGPYLGEMRQTLAGTPCTFTGYLEGEDLAQVYASCDLFVFPSATDTFGNVVLEAQASGLPVLVTDVGGPRENLLPGRTGLVVEANDESALLRGMCQLIDHPLGLQTLGGFAREYAESRSFERAFEETWDMLTTPAARNGYSRRRESVTL